jgi:hypothetical protein
MIRGSSVSGRADRPEATPVIMNPAPGTETTADDIRARTMVAIAAWLGVSPHGLPVRAARMRVHAQRLEKESITLASAAIHLRSPARGIAA